MENAEKTTESMLLEEVMEESDVTVPDSGDANEVGSLCTSDGALSEAAVTAPDGELPQHLLETEQETPNDVEQDESLAQEEMIDDNHGETLVAFEQDNEAESLLEGHQEDAEMTEPGEEETEADSVAFGQPEATSHQQEEEHMEIHDEAISTTDDFLAETKVLLVEGEPPQQLMEEADAPQEETDGENMVGTSGIEESSDAQAAVADESMFEYVEDKPQEPLQERAEGGLLLEHSGGHVDQDVLDSLAALAQGPELHATRVMENASSISNIENPTELPHEGMAADSATDAGATMLPLPEGGAESGSTEGASGFTVLAAGDHIGASLGDLDGKLVVNPDGTVHLLSGQESLQGMQLMEGDDKPEEEANGEVSAAQMQEHIRAQLHEALMKQEEIKQELEEREPSACQPGSDADALATLASAALDHQTPSNGMKIEPESSEVKSDEPQWMDVGICKGTHCVVRTFFVPNEGQSWDKNWQGVTTSTLPDHRALAKLELEAGKAYKFRVAAINSCGRGPWSEIAAFRTSMPGVPSAPSSIKISKTTEGAHLSWDPPSAASGHIADYTVYMAVRKATTDSQVVSSGATQLAFVRIYQGAENQCSVGFETLSEAHIDGGAKPAILFRIAARNEKGLGPAIQVRWLQDGAAAAVNSANKPAVAPRRVGPEIKPHTSIKRMKGECD